jgi:tRNA(Ile)-lysidine synthase
MAVPNLQDQFNHKLNSFCLSGQLRKLAIAVSGGSDSMALALLAQNWAVGKRVELFTLTVDHGLRDGARDEAETVGRWMISHGLNHQLLTWKGRHPTTGIQKAAREARYLLMSEYCRDQGITTLLLGHQLEDQLETLLMRLSKGSGIEGLAAMKSDTRQFGLRLLRPLLEFERQALRDYLISSNQNWIDDPSNTNLKYTRTQVGAVLSELVSLPGSNISALALSAKRISRASDALEMMASQRMREHFSVSPFGPVRFREEAILDCAEEIGIRLLKKVFSVVRGKPVSQNLQALEDIYTRLFGLKESTSETLGGVQILKSGKEWLVIREPGRDGLPEIMLAAGTGIIWDHRFHVMDTAPEKDRDEVLIVKRIGSEGWRQIKSGSPANDGFTLLAKVRNNLPAVWQGERIVAAPLFSAFRGQSTIAHDRFKMVFKALI